MRFRRCASAVALRIVDQRRHDDKNKAAQQKKLFLNLNLLQGHFLVRRTFRRGAKNFAAPACLL